MMKGAIMLRPGVATLFVWGHQNGLRVQKRAEKCLAGKV